MKIKLMYQKDVYKSFFPLWIEAMTFPNESLILVYE